MSVALSNDAATQLKMLYAEMQPRSLYPLWEVMNLASARRHQGSPPALIPLIASRTFAPSRRESCESVSRS